MGYGANTELGNEPKVRQSHILERNSILTTLSSTIVPVDRHAHALPLPHHQRHPPPPTTTFASSNTRAGSETFTEGAVFPSSPRCTVFGHAKHITTHATFGRCARMAAEMTAQKYGKYIVIIVVHDDLPIPIPTTRLALDPTPNGHLLPSEVVPDDGGIRIADLTRESRQTCPQTGTLSSSPWTTSTWAGGYHPSQNSEATPLFINYLPNIVSIGKRQRFGWGGEVSTVA
ncbi:hypothetical protein NLJ89_g8482 [Agrocybe chaxingu]|uniref:Uncharacterized protein n=1 Tax=Agrocybe chaxingu TaxID=84603 RepID=A0A9W8MSQ1_9AGAR|nr:hypothetical protein NLJ89_g8482 [Agrocybe chaxingu]